MEATISKTFRLEAAHQLPNHQGKCARLHGHSYRVEIRVTGDVKAANGDQDEGMVVDFAEVNEVWGPLHRRLDHQLLNDQVDFPTTAENLAGWLLSQLRAEEPLVCAVRVYETAGSWAEVST